MKILIFWQQHLICPLPGLAEVCDRVGEAMVAVKALALSATTFSLPDFHLTIAWALVLRSLYFEDKLKKPHASV